jgi:glycosyltransferase involved in cell wall biosynthesis
MKNLVNKLNIINPMGQISGRNFTSLCLLRYLSKLLQEFPPIWRFAVKVYGFIGFNPNTTKFKYNKSNLTQIPRTHKNYELIFDAQCLQTSTRERGIGKYSLEFIKAMCSKKPDKVFGAMLTTLAPNTDIELAIDLLRNLSCPNLDIILIDPFKTLKDVSLIQAQETVSLELEKLKFRAIVVLSPLEKPNTVVPIGFESNFKKFAVLYDLIPLHYADDILMSRWQKTSYSWSIESLKNFDLLLAISEATRDDWNEHIHFESRVEVIYGGISEKDNSLWKPFVKRFGIVCVAAEQRHKNVTGLLNAYSNLPKEIQVKHNLFILGIRSHGVKRRINKISKSITGQVVVLNYLSKAEISRYYFDSRILVMPSLIEGLSLPILEAWGHGLLSIGSRGTVAKEIIFYEDLLFDPNSKSSLVECMSRFLTSEEDWDDALYRSIKRSSSFSWEKTADLGFNAIEKVLRD